MEDPKNTQMSDEEESKMRNARKYKLAQLTRRINIVN